MRRTGTLASLAVLLTTAACTENESVERTVEEPSKQIAEESEQRIVGSWVIDETAQREEVARVSPSELENFDEAFRMTLASIRETFYSDGRYEVTSPLGGPFGDRWELVSEDTTTVTVRSSGHSWIARRAMIGMNSHERSASVLTYTFSDPDHMVVTTRIPLFGEEKDVSYFFVRDE
jgi:hypothetical protein